MTTMGFTGLLPIADEALKVAQFCELKVREIRTIGKYKRSVASAKSR